MNDDIIIIIIPCQIGDTSSPKERETRREEEEEEEEVKQKKRTNERTTHGVVVFGLLRRPFPSRFLLLLDLHRDERDDVLVQRERGSKKCVWMCCVGEICLNKGVAFFFFFRKTMIKM